MKKLDLLLSIFLIFVANSQYVFHNHAIKNSATSESVCPKVAE